MENEEREVTTNMVEVADKGTNIRNRVIAGAVYIVLAGGFFFFGYQIGQLAIPEPVAAVVEETVINTDTETAAETLYEVCTQDGRLCLYKVNGDEKVELASEEVSTELFPYNDRNELKNGLVFETFDAAQARFEDFVS